MNEFFIQRSDGAYVSFVGMHQQEIIDMLAAQGMTCTFISENAFNAYAEANRQGE
jgi:hypothetical protein